MRVRASDGSVLGDGLASAPHTGLLLIDDATGFVSASTPTEEVVDAEPVTVGTLTSGMTGSVSAGTLTANRAGLYKVTWSGTVLSGNASVLTLEVQKNGAAIAATAAAGGAIKNINIMAATAATISFAMSGVVSLTVADTLRCVVTGTVGTVTIKSSRFEAVQITDATVPTPASNS